MKIWVKVVYGSIKLQKKPPPPLRNPGYATVFAVLLEPQILRYLL